MPAQPPFLTPTRTPMIELVAFAITYLMRSAAASVSRITWGLGRRLAIARYLFFFALSVFTFFSFFAFVPFARPRYVGGLGAARNIAQEACRGSGSPHVERSARLVRHPALIPGRIPHDINLDLAHAGHARHRVLDHDRQFLGRRAIGRGQRHLDRDLA